MRNINPQYLVDDKGQKTSVLLSIKEYQYLIQCLEDLEESHLDAAILLYQEDEVTLGRAAELAGIHRFKFEEALAARGIVRIIEVDSAEALKARIEPIKCLHKSKGNVEGQES